MVIGTLAHMGGAERQALYLVQHLASLSGCTVEVLAFEEGEVVRARLDDLGVRVHLLPYYFRWSRARRGRALARLGLMLRTTVKPDALIPFVGIHSKTMAMVWPFSGARFCWWNQQDEGRDLGGTPTEARLLRKVSCIVSNSFAGRDFLADTYGLDRESIFVYNNGTPLPELPKGPGSWRTKPGLEERPIVTMLANVTQFKDHATLIDAWALVKEQLGHGACPALLLAGHLREASTVAQLKLRAFDLGLSSDDVHFLGSVEDTDDLITASDLVVHSSLTEGCPNAVCEAMALARPVVATDIAGCRQALGDESDAWLVGARDARGLAAAIVRALDDEGLRREAGTRNRARIASDFSVQAMNRFFQARIEAGIGRSLS